MKWEQKHLDFIANNVKGISLVELCNRFNCFFGTSVSESALKNQKSRLHLKSGITGGQFPKGNISWNTGRKGLYTPGSEKGWFKKGGVCHNKKPIGSTRITVDGYVEIKVAQPRTWKQAHRLEWQKHYGAIPRGKVIIFLDGNKQNFAIENLAIITRSEHARLNQNKLRFENADLTKAGIGLTRLNMKVREVEA